MSQIVEIKIKNIDKVIKMADKFPAIAQKHIDRAIVRTIGEVDIQTKPLTPVKTGRLRSSMLPRFAPFQGIYGTRVPYAVRVHNLYSPGTPYKRPSLNKRAVAGFLTIGVKKSERVANEAFDEALKNIAEDLVK